MKKILLPLALLLVPLSTFALNLTYPKFGGPDLNNLPKGQELTSIVAWFYVFFVMTSGLAAFVMIVWGGVQWMSSQGNPTQITDAKDKIQKALLGLLLVLASFLILQIINPELTLLKEPTLPAPPAVSSASSPGTTQKATGALPVGVPDGVYLLGQNNERILAGNSPALVESLGAWNDRATALAIQGPYDALLYEHIQGGGRVICFTDSVIDLKQYIIVPGGTEKWAGEVSSLKIMQDGECKIPGITFPTEKIFTEYNVAGVLLCRNTSCSRIGGKDFLSTDQSLNSLVDVGGNWDNNVAALEITGPYAVLLYEHIQSQNNGGKVICFSSPNIKSLNQYEIAQGNNWADDVSSVELLSPGVCPSSIEGETFQNRDALQGASQVQ